MNLKFGFREDSKLVFAEPIHCLHFDKNNTLWLFGENGIYNKKKTDSIYYKYDGLNQVKELRDFLDFNEAPNGDWWLATVDAGIFCLRQTAEDSLILVHHFNETNGLVSNNCQSITFDDDQNVWVSTARGVTRIQKNNNLIVNYDVYSGVPYSGYPWLNIFSDGQGNIWGGSTKGLFSFSPKEIEINTVDVKLNITNIQVNGDSTAYQDYHFREKINL